MGYWRGRDLKVERHVGARFGTTETGQSNTTLPHTMSFFDPIEFGAKADGSTSDTRAIQSAVDAAFNNGGGIVLFRSGKTYVSGSLVLKSNVTLHLEQGSLLKCSTVSSSWL